MSDIWNIRDFYQEIPEFKLEDISGREQWKQLIGGCYVSNALSEMLYLPRTQYFLISGACGVGKETLAQAAAGEFGARGHQLINVYTDDMTGENSAQTREHITALFQEMKPDHPLVVIWQEIDRLEDKTVILHLRRKLYEAASRKLPVIIFALAESEEEVPEQLRKLFIVCRLENPNEQERREYFQAQLEPLVFLEPGFDSHIMAEMTDGCSYAELDHIVLAAKNLFCHSAGKSVFSPELAVPMIEAGRIKFTRTLFETALNIVKPPSLLEKNAAEEIAEVMPENEIRKDNVSENVLSGDQTLAALAQMILNGQEKQTVSQPEEAEPEDEDPLKQYKNADGKLSEDVDPLALLGFDFEN